MTELADHEHHRITEPKSETWFVAIRYFIAMTLIAIGGILTIIWAIFLGWLGGKAFYL